MSHALPADLLLVLVVFGTFILSRSLQRFRIPSAITCIALGVGFGIGVEELRGDSTVHLLALIGIGALFLFAGMDIDFRELRRGTRALVQHLAISVVALAAATMLIERLLELPLRPAVLVALALLTPSTGFILDSLASLDLTDEERFWIKSKAIATEIVALGVLFFDLQSSSTERLLVSSGVLLAMVAILPLLFRGFAKLILPWAPKTEFAFLILVALVCASITKRLGVYYLIGAFLVGITEQRLRKRLPSMTTERLVSAVELFAGFFIPFYFFNAGLGLRPENFSVEALELGGLFLLLSLPVRVALIAAHRRLRMREPVGVGGRIGVALLPTLVFTLVLAEILRDRFGASPAIVGGLTVYALTNTLVPGLLLRRRIGTARPEGLASSSAARVGEEVQAPAPRAKAS